MKQFIKNFDLKFKLLELLKWKFIDIYRFFKHKPKPHLYGVRCVTGMYGCGKTVTLSKIGLDYRKKYGKDVLITSNFGFKLQDFPFTNLSQMVEKHDKPIIFLWDEVQNQFPATDKNFPETVRSALTLNRKGNGTMFFWSSQDHELVHKTIRRLTIEYCLVKTLFGRYTTMRWFTALDYAYLFEQVNWEKRLKIHAFKRRSFVQTDDLRELYNSFTMDNGEQLEKD